MKSWNPDGMVETLKWRYAVKKFDTTKKVSSGDWLALRQALVLTPSSYGLQPWRFLHIENRDTLKRLTPASWNQAQVEDCSHYMVFCSAKKFGEADIDRYLGRIAEVRGQSVDQLSAYRNVMVKDLVVAGRSKAIDQWMSNQVYIALGNLMTCAAALSIDTCPMEGIEPDKYDEILGLPAQNLRTVVGCAVGYRSAEDKYSSVKKVRFNESEVFQVI